MIFLKGTTMNVERATVRLQITEDRLVKCMVELNEVQNYLKNGRDVIVDWHLLDNVETGSTLYFDANGLEMQTKYLDKRKEYPFKTDNRVASNFYPVTTQLTVRDQSGFSNKQFTILTDRSQAASAGMRDQANMEFMI